MLICILYIFYMFHMLIVWLNSTLTYANPIKMICSSWYISKFWTWATQRCWNYCWQNRLTNVAVLISATALQQRFVTSLCSRDLQPGTCSLVTYVHYLACKTFSQRNFFSHIHPKTLEQFFLRSVNVSFNVSFCAASGPKAEAT